MACLFVSFSAFAGERSEISALEAKINQSLEERAQLAAERKELERQIADFQNRIKARKILIVKRLKALDRLKSFRWGELLVDSNLNDINRNMKILGNLSHYDLELFKEYATAFALLAQSRKNLVETDRQIENNIQVYKKRISDLRALEDIVRSQLAKENTDSFLLLQGKLPRPLDGAVEREFGNIRDTEGQYYLINFGEYYARKKSEFVRSVGPGVVIFRDALAGWRETLVIRHSDDYYSVYAGVKNVTKKVGDPVLGAETLGTLAGGRMYFELRHFANAINPQKWFEVKK